MLPSYTAKIIYYTVPKWQCHTMHTIILAPPNSAPIIPSYRDQWTAPHIKQCNNWALYDVYIIPIGHKPLGAGASEVPPAAIAQITQPLEVSPHGTCHCRKMRGLQWLSYWLISCISRNSRSIWRQTWFTPGGKIFTENVFLTDLHILH